MKILVVHNKYQSSAPSGENTYVEKEIIELRRNGYEVRSCYIENDSLGRSKIGKAVAIAEIIFPLYAFVVILRSVYNFNPDRIHFHNTFPRIGWLPVRFFARKSVLTLHNYRLFCANGMALRDGRICTRCAVKSGFIDSLRFKCYRDSLISTLGVQLYMMTMRKFANLRNINAIFCFSAYQKELISARLQYDCNNIKIKNNTHPIVNIKKFTEIPSKPRVAFVGRFSEEKGLKDLLSCIIINPSLFEEVHIVGGASADLERIGFRKANIPENIIFHGKLPQHQVSKILSRNHILFVPSTCLEGQPTVVFEALEQGCLPIVSEVPTLADFIVKLGLNSSFDFKEHWTFRERLTNLIIYHNRNLNQINADVASSLQNFVIPDRLYEEN